MEAQGDAGEAILWLCYSAIRGHEDESLWLISSAELGGDTHAITEVVVKKVGTHDPSVACPRLPPDMSRIVMRSRVWLGTTVPDVRSTLGEPQKISGDWYVYSYAGKVPGNCNPGGLDRDKWILIRFAGRLVVEIHAGQTTTC
jgi:hypothetical protein